MTTDKYISKYKFKIEFEKLFWFVSTFPLFFFQKVFWY